MLYYCNHCKENSIARKVMKLKNGNKIRVSYCINKGCQKDRELRGATKPCLDTM